MHRKIWESAFGTIPKDDTGRSYEIHHIDKNHNNNALENLKLVTIEEHFNIHFQQGDHGACWAIAKRMNVSVEDSKKIQSIMAKQLARKRIEKGTHNFNSQLSKETQAKRIEEGTHNFQGEQGSLNAIQRNKKLVELGKHPWAGELGKKHNKELSLLRVEKGTHNFQGNSNPNKNMPKVICPHCSKEGGRNQMKRYHFDNCKHKE
jgi:hypothetical protein